MEKIKIKDNKRGEQAKMKKKKISVLSLAVLLGINYACSGVSTTAFAQENTDIMNVAAIDTRAVDTVYVQTGANGGGNGTLNSPYNDFKDAYTNVNENGTIVVLNAVPIQNDDNNLDQGVFTFKKNITIQGNGVGTLSSRVKVQLGANVKLDNVSFFAEELYLNGFTLEMNQVKTIQNQLKRTTVYGGAFNQDLNKPNGKSCLVVNGFAQTPFEFKNIYAGSKTNATNVAVDIQLNSGAKVIGTMDASGEKHRVQQDVQFTIGNVSVSNFTNGRGTFGADLYFKNHINTNGYSIRDYRNVTLDNSKITFDDGIKFTGLDGTLELKGNSRLDVSKNAGFSPAKFSSEAGSILVFNMNGIVDVAGEFSGALEVRTPEQADQSTSGPVTLNQVFFKAGNVTGQMTYKPYFTQPNVQLVDEVGGDGKHGWKFVKKQIDKPIHSLEVVEDKRVNINELQHEFTLEALDRDGNALNYAPVYTAEIFNENGQTEDNVWVSADGVENKLYIEILDDVPEGNYKIKLIDVETGKVFEFAFVFHKNAAPTTYLVTFNSQGGSAVVSQNVAFNALVQKPEDPTRTGYTFGGWYKEESCQTEWNFTGDTMPASDLTLYAKWTANNYSIKFDANGGTGNMNVQEMVYDKAANLTTSTFTREGYTFKGWAKTEDGPVAYLNSEWVNNLTDQPNGVVTLYAVWGINKYDVTFNSQGGSAVVSQNVEYNALVQEPTEPTKAGYTFGGWYKEAECQTAWNFTSDRMLASNLMLYAKWILNTPEANHAPVIKVEDKVLTVGDTFNPLHEVTAHDEEDGDIVLTDANIIANNVNTTVAGTYHVTYKVTDSNGVSVEKTITVTVKEENAEKPETPQEPQQPQQPDGTTKPSEQTNNIAKPNKPSGQTNKTTKLNKQTKSAQTGDMSKAGLFTSMLVGSTGALAILLGKRRKKK
ncbi:MAG: InlB B-repeat-containing protein [Proteus hauseri]|nr:InlB B-repeat-containing protein [Proteus hauseri]